MRFWWAYHNTHGDVAIKVRPCACDEAATWRVLHALCLIEPLGVVPILAVADHVTELLSAVMMPKVATLQVILEGYQDGHRRGGLLQRIVEGLNKLVEVSPKSHGVPDC